MLKATIRFALMPVLMIGRLLLYHHDFFSDHWVGNRGVCDIRYGGVLHWILAERHRSPGAWNPGQPDRAPCNRQLYAEEA